MLRVLFVHTYPPGDEPSFVRTDMELLREFCLVEEFSLSSFKSLLRQPLRSPAVWKAVARNDLAFGWFGDCAPVIVVAKILRKPSIIVGGGYDVVSVPEINYGLSTESKSWVFRKTLGFRLASRILCFSEFSRRSLLLLPGMREARAQTLYLGVDADRFRPSGPKSPQILTVSYIAYTNLHRKGLKTFMQVAGLAPELQLRICGKPVDAELVREIKETCPSNLKYLGYLEDSELIKQYQSARVYAQLSLHEGFGLALAEAMACECTPVVTDRGAMPEVVGDTGIYVPPDDPSAAREAFKQALHSNDNTLGRRARERIVELFSLAKRRSALREAVESIASGA